MALRVTNAFSRAWKGMIPYQAQSLDYVSLILAAPPRRIKMQSSTALSTTVALRFHARKGLHVRIYPHPGKGERAGPVPVGLVRRPENNAAMT